MGSFEAEIADFQELGVALAIGVLIGIERGWQERQLREGSRVAGIRTFGIVGLLGGVWAMLAETLGVIVLGFAFLAFSAVMLVARVQLAKETKDYGATTVVASMLTFVLGALAASGEMQLAAAAAVVTTLLLGVKPILHGWLEKISFEELLAVLKLLVMSLVLLPVLPNRGYGPWQALNPFEMWLMVVLIAGISFLGYAGVRVAGPTRGLLVTAFAGGLASSTAVAVSYARLARDNEENRGLFAAGIVLAAATMFPRTIVVTGVIQPALLPLVAWPLGLAGVTALAAVGLAGLRQTRRSVAAKVKIANPFEFAMALQFGILLAVIMLLVSAAEAWLGDAGVFGLAALSGIADVDAINLSLSRVAGERMSFQVAATGIALACLSNTLVKAAIAIFIARRVLLLPVATALGASFAAGAIGLFVMWRWASVAAG